MDNITHTLVGIDVANAFFRKRYGRESVWVLAAASNVTDIDAVVHLSGRRTAILMRRTFGHSLFLMPLWALLLAWLFRRRYPNFHWKPLVGLCVLGILLHLFFDLINSFGVVLFWPFSDFRPELSIVFIIDLVLMGLLGAPLLLNLTRKIISGLLGGTSNRHALPGKGSDTRLLTSASRWAVVYVSAYLIFCAVNRHVAYGELQNFTRPLGLQDFSYVFPEPLGPHRWKGVVRSGQTYHVYLIHSLTGQIDERGTVDTQTGDPRVEEARRTPLGRKLDWFFKAPVWQADGNTVTAYDLRFQSFVINRKGAFQYRFIVHPDGSISVPN